jgi:hypothetical protein
MKDSFNYQLHNTINTKEVEINFTDYTDSVPATIFDIIVRYYLANVYMDRVKHYTYFPNYDNTREFILSSEDTARMIISLLYLIHGRQDDRSRNNIFSARLLWIQRPWKYSYDELTSLMEYYSVEDKNLTQQIVDYHTDYPYQLRSTSETMSYLNKKYIDHLTDWLFISNVHSLKRDRYFKNVIKNLYQEMDVDFNNGETIDAFIRRIDAAEVLEYDKDKLETLLFS